MKSILDRDTIRKYRNNEILHDWRVATREFYDAQVAYEAAKAEINSAFCRMKINTSNLIKLDKMHEDLLLKRDVYYAKKHKMNSLAIYGFQKAEKIGEHANKALAARNVPVASLSNTTNGTRYGFLMKKADLAPLIVSLINLYGDLDKQNGDSRVRFVMNPASERLDVSIVTRGLNADKN